MLYRKEKYITQKRRSKKKQVKFVDRENETYEDQLRS